MIYTIYLKLLKKDWKIKFKASFLHLNSFYKILVQILIENYGATCDNIFIQPIGPSDKSGWFIQPYEELGV
jgi:hypothetical protein